MKAFICFQFVYYQVRKFGILDQRRLKKFKSVFILKFKGFKFRNFEIVNLNLKISKQSTALVAFVKGIFTFLGLCD